jgi:hypothetical protein
VVRALYRHRKTLETSLVTPADIALRDIMATRENSISDSSQVDFNIFCPDVDQHDLEAAISRINENLPGGSDCRCSGDAWLESLTDSIWIEKRSLIDEARSAVSVDLPQPLAPAMMFSRGRVTEHS